MLERDIETKDVVSKEQAQPHYQLKHLVKRSAGIATTLGERRYGGWSVLVPHSVSFYVPDAALSDPSVQRIVGDFSPIEVGPVPDSAVVGLAQKDALFYAFDSDPDQARITLRQAKAVTFAVDPGTKSPGPLEQGMQANYEQFTQALNVLRERPQKAAGLLDSDAVELVREPLQLAVYNPRFAEALAALHTEIQGSWGVSSLIENRQGQWPKIVDWLRSIQKVVDVSNTDSNHALKLIDFYYLAVEPYYNLGPDQGLHPAIPSMT
jgi:hypothetical protein